MSMNQNSTLSLSENLVNLELKERILAATGDYVTAYQVAFSGGAIDVNLALTIPKLGDVAAKYRLEVLDFKFDREGHRVTLAYQEDVRPAGGPLQAFMLKAFGLTGGTWLTKALALANLNGITADEKSCSVDLEQLLDLSNEWVRQLALNYVDSRDGLLKLEFRLLPPMK